MNSHKTLMAASSSALILRPAWSWAQTATEPNKYDWDHMSPMMWGGGWYGMIFGPLFMLLALAVVIAVVVILVRWTRISFWCARDDGDAGVIGLWPANTQIAGPV